MIEELHIAGLGVIEDATLTLAAGLTVVTGETGAGKTMVVTALQLLLGARADIGLVRSGADVALIEARISPIPSAAADWVADGDEELLVAREIAAKGRSRARINGRMATAATLADVLAPSVEVHGQGEQMRLQRPEVQRRLLDQFAGDGHARVLDRYAAAYRTWRDATAQLAGLDTAELERRRELDVLRFQLDEIGQAGIDLATDRSLDARLDVLEHAEELGQATAAAGHAIGEDGAADLLGVAVAAVRRVDVDDPSYNELRERIEALVAEAHDLSIALRDHSESVEVDPEQLDLVRDRRHLLGQLRAKYGRELEDVVAFELAALARLDELEGAEAARDTLSERAERAHRELTTLAAELHAGRLFAADLLTGAVNGHLAELGMPHATFEVAVAPSEDTGQGFGTEGSDRVTYLLAANPGEPAGPLSQVASGGERSRVALAIEVALADVHDAEVLVFDEIDAGIGGATAMAVGEKLARLAAGRQVLCVTHLAQLAAFADVHHVVEKGLRGGRTVTTTRQVAQDARPAELSRMLSGDPTRDAALEHARELLDEAAGRRAS